MRQEHDLTFLHMLWSRPVRVTYIIFAFNILVFLIMEFAGGTQNDATLLAFGAKFNPLIDAGEIWRFVTPIFIHIGILHMIFNSYALWIIGPQVEKLYGGARFSILYVLAGVGGVAASYWYHPRTMSAGASGAIFGLFGVLLVFVIKYRKSIPPEFRNALGRGVFITVGINLLIGYSIPFIDNSAHLGGLVSGAVLAALIPYAPPQSETNWFYRILQAVLVIVVAASFVQVAAHYNGPGLSIPGPASGLIGGGTSSNEEFLQVVRVADNALDVTGSRLLVAQPSDFPVMSQRLAEVAGQLRRLSMDDSTAEDLRRDLLRLINAQLQLVNDVEQSGGLLSFEHRNKLADNQRQFEQFRTRIQAWLRQ